MNNDTFYTLAHVMNEFANKYLMLGYFTRRLSLKQRTIGIEFFSV